MFLNTTSEVISFSEEMENKSIEFYELVSQRIGRINDVLNSFIKENKSNIKQIRRSYYGSITDAIEGCFGFNIDKKNYIFELSVTEGMTYPDVLNKIIEIEKNIKLFYEDAAEQTQSLMTDVARVFIRVAKKRDERISKIKSLQKV